MSDSARPASTPGPGSRPPSNSAAEHASAGPYPDASGALDRALALVEYLRTHCPWDAAQTSRSLVPHLLEETHETVDAIRQGDAAALRAELGDLLLNLAFQIVVAEQDGAFTRSEVIEALEAKMIRRHPHLFGLGEKEPWETIKARERRDAGDTGGTLAGLASGLDPLLRAYRIQEKAAGVGFDWDDASGALSKIREELEEAQVAVSEGDPAAVAEEMGDLLFAAVNFVRLSGVHAVPALESANAKFRRRFEAVEALARARGVPLPGASLEELDRLWDEVKAEEKHQPSPEALSTRAPDPPRSEGAPPDRTDGASDSPE